MSCRSIFLLPLIALLASCSITPEKAVTRQELYRTNVFSEFTIKDTPESVLAGSDSWRPRPVVR